MQQLSKNNPIGIFDSGVGGLTVFKRLLELLPNESFYYYADSGNCPYGPLSKEEIWRNTCKIMDALSLQKCKLIIVACNTITTNSIDRLRKRYKVPIIGMEPGTKMAFKHSEGKRIGILATQGTLNGGLFNKTLQEYHDKAFFIRQVGEGLVTLIEQDALDAVSMHNQLSLLLEPMILAEIDTLVLGCTHYNYLIHQLQKYFPYPIQIIDTTEPVAQHVKNTLTTQGLMNPKKSKTIHVETSGNLAVLKKIIKRLTISESDLKKLNLSCSTI